MNLRRLRAHSSLLSAALATTSLVALGAVLDDTSEPPPSDPSAFTGPLIGEDFAIDGLADLPPANEGTFAGGTTGTLEDAHEDVVLRPKGTGVDIPTGAPPSHVAGAACVRPAPAADEAPAPFPQPSLGSEPENDPSELAASGPNGVELEEFLAQDGISPFPTEYANTSDANTKPTAAHNARNSMFCSDTICPSMSRTVSEISDSKW